LQKSRFVSVDAVARPHELTNRLFYTGDYKHGTKESSFTERSNLD